MPNILLTRIDNRLIHGQIAVVWTTHIGANLILVANDEVAGDPMQQSLMDMAVSEGIATRYFTIEETIEKISQASKEQKIFIVVRDPQDVLRLVEGGVMIKEVNIGNMHYEKGKEQVTKSVALDNEDRKALRELNKRGVKLYVRRVPVERKTDIIEFI